MWGLKFSEFGLRVLGYRFSKVYGSGSPTFCLAPFPCPYQEHPPTSIMRSQGARTLLFHVSQETALHQAFGAVGCKVLGSLQVSSHLKRLLWYTSIWLTLGDVLGTSVQKLRLPGRTPNPTTCRGFPMWSSYSFTAQGWRSLAPMGFRVR